MVAVPREVQLLVQPANLFDVAAIENCRTANRQADRMTKHGLPFAAALEKFERLFEEQEPRRAMHAAVRPFPIGDHLQIVKRLRSGFEKLRQRRVEQQADAELLF
jgi:hypothetical protein